jgi:esterase/lipase superfamily enzyme
VLFFPTRQARFFDYENWGVVEALRPRLESGGLQLYCVDSLDAESLYCQDKHPAERVRRHLQYERYLLHEVLPLSEHRNPYACLLAAGCSMGAFHAVNIAFRYPQLFAKVAGLSGRYDLTQSMGCFRDLFQGYVDQEVYLSTPNRFLPNLHDEFRLAHLRRLDIRLAIGADDAFCFDKHLLSEQLSAKGIPHQLHVWAGEAHTPADWQQMIHLYL